MNNKEISSQESGVRSQRKRFLYLVLIIFVGILLRAGFLVTPHIDSDQAIFGLQGRHILQGEFPIFSWGYAYIGTFQSYLDALAFYIFGSSRLVLNAVTTFLSILFIIITYHLGKDLRNESTGIIGAAAASISPPYLTVHGAWARHGYMETLLFGSLLLLVTLRLLKTDDRKERGRLLILLGFISGIGFWTNFLIVVYFPACGLYLLLKDKRILKKETLLSVLFFIIGSLPFWIYNLRNSFESRGLLYAGHKGPFIKNLKDAILIGLPEMIGINTAEILPWPSYILLSIYLLSFILLIIVGMKDLITRPSSFVPRHFNGSGLILLFLLSFLVIFSLSSFGIAISAWRTIRYLLPLYSVIPLILSLFIFYLMERWRSLPIILLLLVFSFNIYWNITDFWFLKGGYERHREMMRLEKELFDFLKSENLRYVVTEDYWTGPKLTFDSAEEIIFASSESNRYQRYTEMINSAENRAYLFVGGNELVENALKGAGFAYKKKSLGQYTVFYSIVPSEDCLRGIPSKGWKGYASVSGSQARNGLDRDITTRWNSGTPRQKGMWFMLDLGREYPVCRVSLHPGTFILDSPDNFTVETSKDGKRWERAFDHLYPIVQFLDRKQGGADVLFPGVGDMDRHNRLISLFDLIFPPQKNIYHGLNRYNQRIVVLDGRNVRYIKITLNEDNTKYHWSIGELFVYEKGQVLKQVQDISSVLKKAIEYERKNEIKEAVNEYLRVISLFPDFEEPHLRLGNIYASSGVTDTPSFSRGKVFERLGIIEKAMRDYERVLQADSWSRSQLLYLSGFYQSIGEKEKVELIEKKLSEGFEPKTKMNIKYGGAVRLLGIDINPSKIKRGEKVRIVYYWKALKRMDKDYAIFVHFKRGERIVFQNDHYPMSGGYQTSAWEKGDIIRESYDILVPENAESGVYNLTIGIWNPEDERRLKIRKNIFKSVKEFSIEKALEVMY